MEITYNNAQNRPLVITIGNFDGVHLGHQHIINLAIEKAKNGDFDSGLLTFYPHPLEILTGNKVDKLSSWQQRKDIFKKMGLNTIILQPFNREISNLDYKIYIERLLNRFNIKEIIVGEDFRCGYKNLGTPKKIARLGEKYNYSLTVVPGLKFANKELSSTNIRNEVQLGNLKKVNKMLGRDYIMQCKVIEGDQRGRDLGFPTANLEPEINYILPKKGVYAARLKLNDKYYDGVVNLGQRPTFNKKDLSIEIHIFDFEQIIYGKRVELEIVARIRGEKEFDGRIQLIEAIKNDIKVAKSILK